MLSVAARARTRLPRSGAKLGRRRPTAARAIGTSDAFAATSSAVAAQLLASSEDDKPVEAAPDEVEVVDAEHVGPSPATPVARHRRLDVRAEESSYTSPLPSPDDLGKYEAIIPGAGQRLLSAGEKEQEHRHQLESRLAALDEGAMPQFFSGQRRGHLISLALGVGYEVVMAVAILSGAAVPGVVGAAAGIGAMVWAVRRDTDGGAPPPPSPPGDAAANAGDAADDKSPSPR